MKRITIYETDEDGQRSRLGWFDLSSALHVLEEDATWNESSGNHLGNVSGLQTSRADLYRTSGGRWVEHHDASNEFSGPDRWTFLTDDQARDWMIKSGGLKAEEALEEWFPDTPDEAGPNSKGGRPAIDGPQVPIQFPRVLLDKIDAAAKEAGLSRAAWVRKVTEEAVAPGHESTP